MRGWSVLVVSAAVGVIGRLLGSLELLCAGLAGAFAFGATLFLAVASRRPRVHFERRLPPETFADEQVTVDLVASSGRRRTPTVVVHEHTGPDSHRTFGLAAMRPGCSRTITYSFDAGVRGVRTIGPCQVTRVDPLGFARRIGTIGAPVTLVVWPQPRLAAMADLFTKSEPVPVTVRSTGTERELADIRPFVDGDELRRVHWRTTARTGQLMVRSDADVRDRARPLIVVDARVGAHTAESLELALAVVCGYALDEMAAPRVLVVTESASTFYDERASVLGALARVPAGGDPQFSAKPPAPLEPIVIRDGERPDLLVAGPFTQLAGASRRVRAVLRCDANGTDSTLHGHAGG